MSFALSIDRASSVNHVSCQVEQWLFYNEHMKVQSTGDVFLVSIFGKPRNLVHPLDNVWINGIESEFKEAFPEKDFSSNVGAVLEFFWKRTIPVLDLLSYSGDDFLGLTLAKMALALKASNESCAPLFDAIKALDPVLLYVACSNGSECAKA